MLVGQRGMEHPLRVCFCVIYVVFGPAQLRPFSCFPIALLSDCKIDSIVNNIINPPSLDLFILWTMLNDFTSRAVFYFATAFLVFKAKSQKHATKYSVVGL